MYGSSHPLEGTDGPDMLDEPEAWLDDVLADMQRRGREEAAHPRRFSPLVIELDPHGTHFIDALFGAEMKRVGGQAWSDPLPIRPADLQMPDLSADSTLGRALRLAQFAVARVREPMLIAAPVLSCPINIGVNLFGQGLFEEMAEDPEGVRHALRLITDVIAYCMRAFGSVIPSALRRNSVANWRYMPEGFGFIDGCATQLVSARHYEAFFADLDAELLAVFPRGGMIHLCGACAQHIPAWRLMTALRALQLNDRATDDFEAFYTGTREDQVIYVTPNERWPVEHILSFTDGRRVVVQGMFEPPS